MLRIIIQGAVVEGKSTLAALISRLLLFHGIAHTVNDPEESNVAALVNDAERLRRNTIAIAERLRAMGSSVHIETLGYSSEFEAWLNYDAAAKPEGGIQ